MDRDARPIRAFTIERLAPATGLTQVAGADTEIRPDNFGTIARIERLVAARRR